MGRYARRLARELGIEGRELDDIERGATLHDIGKIGVRDAVLLKPGPLDEKEWAEMRRHPALGYEILSGLTAYLGYAWVPTFREQMSTVNEHRIWQQAMWSLPLPVALKLDVRPRLEQRLVQGSGDLGHRARLFLRAIYTPVESWPLRVVVHDEAFYQFNDTEWGARGGFDQNRLFVGLGLASDSLRFLALDPTVSV